MLSKIGSRLTYANITATLALVFAMSGGALAATHYLLNSTRQINPKVLKVLKGQTGVAGPKGSQGVQARRVPKVPKAEPARTAPMVRA